MVRYNKVDDSRIIIRDNGTEMSLVDIGKMDGYETDTKNQNNMVPVCLRYTLELCTYE